MDITELVKMIAKMSGMSQKEQEQLEEFIEQLDDIDELDGLGDLEDFDLSDLDSFDFDIDSGMGRRPGKRSVDDYRQDPPEKPDERVQDEIEVDLSDDESDGPYHGHTWVEVEDRYEAFVDIPEEAENADVDISLREDSVYVSDPIDEKLNTDQLPVDVTSLEANLTDGGRLVIQVR